MTELLDAFQLPFMLRALVTLLVLAVAAGTVGVMINLRRLEFLTDGLTHAVFPGLVLGFLAAGEPGLLPGALVIALLSAVLLTLLQRRGVGDQNLIAILLTAFFSIGVILVSTQQGYSGQLSEMLFGRLLSITDSQITVTSVLVTLAVLAVAVTWRQQVFRAFDDDGARASGLRSAWLDVVLNTAVVLVVVAASAAVGTLLVLAVLIVPGAAARLVAPRIGSAVIVATAFAIVTSVMGLVFAWQLSMDLGVQAAPGGVVALTMIAVYLLLLALYGLLLRSGRR
ncbi:MAG TPA: metal ABC transporter permease [Candidatus Agrococcus pullicola]|uniref:Metal ABC transporter permease n=1 Tax=Candidatus Agrococcus pullicola TaxID=2838429 RepID=A0A9D1YXM3_9MICO|nr:metal ABC transporter permease [Candidatus Agrococcus pullicola]